jgi:hypothetical protein
MVQLSEAAAQCFKLGQAVQVLAPQVAQELLPPRAFVPPSLWPNAANIESSRVIAVPWQCGHSAGSSA